MIGLIAVAQELEDLDWRLSNIEDGDSGDYLDQVWNRAGMRVRKQLKVVRTALGCSPYYLSHT